MENTREGVRLNKYMADSGYCSRREADRLIAEGLLPVKRFGTPEDVANMVLACAEGLLDYSAGQVLDADGGFRLRRL